MNEQEKQEYFDRVKRWTEEDYPRLCAVHEAWTASDIKSFDEGCILISALQAARDWLPSKIYQKDIQRRLTWVRDWLDEINRRYGNVNLSSVKSPTELMGRAIYTQARASRSPRFDAVAKEQADAAMAAGKVPPTDMPRPKHLDAYIHLLPADVQARAAELSTLYLKLGQYHNILQSLADPRSAPADRERYAKAVTKTANAIDAIYAAVEAAWEALPASEKAKAGIVIAAPAPTAAVPAPSVEEPAPTTEQETAEATPEPAAETVTVPEDSVTALDDSFEGQESSSEQPASKKPAKRAASTSKKSAAKKTKKE